VGPAIELCCGLGGMGLGLTRLGVDISAGFDVWERALAVYRHNRVGGRAEALDLLDPLGPRKVLELCRGNSRPEILLAGPPCKGVSRLRNGNHDETHNQLFEVIPSYVAALRPRIILLENVPELRTHQQGSLLDRLVRNLRYPARRLRYRVTFAEYDSAQHGTPQVRRRLFVLAIRGKRARLPPSDPNRSSLYRTLRRGLAPEPAMRQAFERFEDPWNSEFVTSQQALSDLPLLGPGVPEEPRCYGRQVQTAYQSRMRESGELTVGGTQTPRVSPKTVERLDLIPMGGCAIDLPAELSTDLNRQYYSAYRRLHPSAPATTLNTRYDCIYHHHFRRSLSVREYARLQGIPDHFEFPAAVVPRRHAYELIGNSVPPPLMEWLGGEVLSSHV
jgi:DNA (cytosine-5)-methyltransferase 1